MWNSSFSCRCAFGLSVSWNASSINYKTFSKTKILHLERKIKYFKLMYLTLKISSFLTKSKLFSNSNNWFIYFNSIYSHNSPRNFCMDTPNHARYAYNPLKYRWIQAYVLNCLEYLNDMFKLIRLIQIYRSNCIFTIFNQLHLNWFSNQNTFVV